MIKMIRGVFGLPVGGIVKAMDKNSDPFEAGAEQEARLIRLGLAVRVDATEPTIAEDDSEVVDTEAPIGFDETPPEDFADEKPIDELTAKELRELGKEYGLSFKVGMTKAEMIAAIKAALPQPADDEGDEPAPAFDATEAVW